MKKALLWSLRRFAVFSPIRLSCYNDRGENDLNVYADDFKMPVLYREHPTFRVANLWTESAAQC